MTLLELFKRIFKIDTGLDVPRVPDDLAADIEKLQMLCADAVRERREMMVQRDVFRDLLKQHGETDRTLAARVAMHKRTLLAKVRASA
jgi:hypothetical protein